MAESKGMKTSGHEHKSTGKSKLYDVFLCINKNVTEWAEQVHVWGQYLGRH